MVTICLHCGDKGAANALVYCIYCSKRAVHRYCLAKLPETLDEFVPWVCHSECVPVAQKVTSRSQDQDQDQGQGQGQGRTSSKHVESSCKNQLLPPSVSSQQLLGQNAEAAMPCSGSTDNEGKVKKNNTLEKKGDKLEKRNPNSLADASQSANLVSPEVAQPVIDPIWSGSFNLMNSKKEADDVDTLVVAHLSKKVGKQVFDEAKLFPSMLDLELHPKANVWPKRFQKLKPSDDDIAIYFFPLSKSYEGVFDELVEEMMEGELALKATTENAELLVFPSNELPLKFWRFQGKYYLWGVFRGKQAAI